ncbi:MAG: MBL fold metallo-hydrolase [Deferrisomatales bacterium]
METTARTAILALLGVLPLLSCGGGSGGQPAALARTAAALGGQAEVEGVTAGRITASGRWFEPEQTTRPGDPPLAVSTFRYTLADDLSADRFRYDWARDVTYPFVQSQAYAEVVDGDAGLVDGADSPAGPARTAMPPVRLAALRTLHRLTSPLALVRSALVDPASVEARPDEVFAGRPHQVLVLTAGPASPIRVFVDPVTSLPAKADTGQDDPYYGDTLYEVVYEDWRPVGAVMAPFKLTQRLTGLGRTVTIQTEERSEVRHDVPPAAGLFAVPAELRAPFDAADARRGEVMAQWFLRRQAIGLPTYADQGLSLDFAEVRPGSGVFRAAGGTHHTLVVELADHLIVLEPALYESRSRAVIAAAKARLPGKPIRHVVVTHFHVDHGGGVRTYAAEGATVVVGEAVRAHFEAILAAPRTLVPDALAGRGGPVTVLGVPEASGLELGDGARTVGVYPVQGQDHVAGLVLGHVSGEDLVFESGDLFSPPPGTVLASGLPAPLRQTFQAFNLPVTAIAAAHGATAAVDHDRFGLPAGFRPEGVAIAGDQLYVGSIPTGRIYRVDLATGRGRVLVEPPPGRSAIGLKVDGFGRLFVAGGQTGQAYVYDAATGAELAVYSLAQGATFINDVIVTPQAAWFTDSRNPTLYRVPIAPDGSLAAPGAAAPLALTGAFQFVAGQTNANGIAATPDGATLLIVQSVTGQLFTVEAATGVTREILLGGEAVPNGDGLLLQGRTLFVVQNRLNQLTVLTLAADLTTGTVDRRVTASAFDVPTTVAARGGHLYLPNARFGIAEPDGAAYSVVRIERP